MLPGDGPTDPPQMSDGEYTLQLESDLSALCDLLTYVHKQNEMGKPGGPTLPPRTYDWVEIARRNRPLTRQN